jgi:hypothetical protein
MDITGWVWYMHKTYISREVALQQLADSGLLLEGDLLLQQEQVQVQQQAGAERDQHGEVIPEWVRESERELLQQPPPPPMGGATAGTGAAPVRLPAHINSAMGSAVAGSVDSSIALWMLAAGDEAKQTSASSRSHIHVSHAAFFSEGRVSAQLRPSARSSGSSSSNSNNSNNGLFSSSQMQREEEELIMAALSAEDVEAAAAATAAGNANNDQYNNGGAAAAAAATADVHPSNEIDEGVVIAEASSGLWGDGFWGVWEPASHTPHFELQKGGVFRAVPIFVLDC